MITFCISTYNNINYLPIAVKSVRDNSYYNQDPFIIHAENCTDGTDEWLEANAEKYNLEYYIDKNDNPKGIGGGMNFCADKAKTEFLMFLHSDFYVTKNWDYALKEVFENNPNEKMWVNSWRVEPQMFPGSQTTPGNIVVPKQAFGAYYNDFNSNNFEILAQQFINQNDQEIPRGLGVSGLIRKSDWDHIGGNDPQFAPTSWDDHDLFLRMENENYKFVTTTKSLIFHFGARGSHRLEENKGKTSERQSKHERVNAMKFYKKWGGMPVFDQYGQIKGVK